MYVYIYIYIHIHSKPYPSVFNAYAGKSRRPEMGFLGPETPYTYVYIYIYIERER